MSAGRPELARVRGVLASALPRRRRGRLTRVGGLALEATAAGVRLGDVAEVLAPGRAPLLGEVVGLREGRAVLAPLGEVAGIGLESEVVALGGPLSMRVGDALRGRILDGLGRPFDAGAAPQGLVTWPIERGAPTPLTRRPIAAALPLGLRAIDGLATVGEGQRVGLFAGAGVGKSTLLGVLARGAGADVVVVGLVGERGREVGELVELLGPTGRARSVVVAATSDAPALVRVKAAHAATAVAEWFADQGRSVLLLVDSVTRYARALREVALAAGEPPARQGYPPSVFAALPRLLERAGNRALGTITAVYTVLVAGDDLDEPIADEVRGLLDGHLVLDRRLAEAGRFPAIDPLRSLSRVMPAVTSIEHRTAAERVRRLLAAHERVRDLVTLGAYKSGTDAEADEALAKQAAIEKFLRQGPGEVAPWDETLAGLRELAA